MSHFEAKKDGLQQKQDGCWKFTINVHPNDMPPWLMQAAMGTRLMIAAVEIGDDEQPVEHEKPAEKPKRSFDTLPRAQQAGILCNESAFAVWIAEKDLFREPRDGEPFADFAAEAVRDICGVKSRSALGGAIPATGIWDRLVADYRAGTGQAAEAR